VAGAVAEEDGDTVPGGLGVAVTVTVGAGRGKIEILARCRGTCTTTPTPPRGGRGAPGCAATSTPTPTTPREVKLTGGRTNAVWVSAPALSLTDTIVPTGTPGTWGLSPIEA